MLREQRPSRRRAHRCERAAVGRDDAKPHPEERIRDAIQRALGPGFVERDLDASPSGDHRQPFVAPLRQRNQSEDRRIRTLCCVIYVGSLKRGLG